MIIELLTEAEQKELEYLQAMKNDDRFFLSKENKKRLQELQFKNYNANDNTGTQNQSGTPKGSENTN